MRTYFAKNTNVSPVAYAIIQIFSVRSSEKSLAPLTYRIYDNLLWLSSFYAEYPSCPEQSQIADFSVLKTFWQSTASLYTYKLSLLRFFRRQFIHSIQLLIP